MKWIKASERLPEVGKPVIWKASNPKMEVLYGHLEDEGDRLWIYDRYDQESASPVEFNEWLDESPSTSTVVTSEEIERMINEEAQRFCKAYEFFGTARESFKYGANYFKTSILPLLLKGENK